MALYVKPKVANHLPELEHRVFDQLIEQKLHLSPQNGEELDYLRKRVAMGRFCLEATELAQAAMEQLGIPNVMAEHHMLAGDDENLHHSFLTIPSKPNVIDDTDTVVDFTYLQFTRNWDMTIAENRPNIFLDSRAAIIELMSDPLFAEPHTKQLYLPHTLVTS